MKKACKNCHFLAQTVTNPVSNIVTALDPVVVLKAYDGQEPDKETRNCVVMSEFHAQCYKGVWDSGYDHSRTKFVDGLKEEIIKERKNCFFFPKQKGMLFPAAEELQERSERNSELKRTSIYSATGLWLSAIALLTTVFMEF